MSANLTQLRVVVVSATDVLEERRIVVEEIAKVNRIIRSKGIQLDHVEWPKDTLPRQGKDSQESVEHDLNIPAADIVITVIWMRFGSGTERELRIAYDSWRTNGQPKLIIHGFRKPVLATAAVDELESLLKVAQYRKSIEQHTLYFDYDDVANFREAIYNHLATAVNSWDVEEERPVDAKPPSPIVKSAEGWEHVRAADIPFYTFLGYEKEFRDENQLRDKDCFQDFIIDRKTYRNPNPVSHLWADAVWGSSITATVGAADGPHLSVTFNNRSSWPSSVAIRPILERAVQTRDRDTIEFEADVAPDSGLEEVAVLVRVINGWCQHWVHGPGLDSPICNVIRVTSEPATIAVSLRDKWSQFASDGNRWFGPAQFDASVLGSIILQLGSVQEGSPPGQGRATVRLRNFRLKKSPRT